MWSQDLVQCAYLADRQFLLGSKSLEVHIFSVNFTAIMQFGFHATRFFWAQKLRDPNLVVAE